MKIKLFLAREIQYFELEIFSFNSYVYYLTRGFIASTRAFNLATRAFSLLTRGFELVTRVLLFHLKLHRKIGVSVSFFSINHTFYQCKHQSFVHLLEYFG